MPLNQLATVSVPEPRLLSVQVWDKSMVKAVEKAIVDSNLGLSPATEGTVLRLRTARTAGSTRASSSTSPTGWAKGRVDSPPISIRSAPSASSRSMRAASVSSVCQRPPSENESGVTLRMPMICMVMPLLRLPEDKNGLSPPGEDNP